MLLGTNKQMKKSKISFFLYLQLYYYKFKKGLIIWWRGIEPLRRLFFGLFRYYSRKKYFWHLFILLVLILLLGIYLRQKNSNEEIDLSGAGKKIETIENKETEMNSQPSDPFLKMSRLTFFLREKLKGSIAVPEIWEGKYRTKEAGNEFLFAYIGRAELESPLFFIKTYPQAEWDKIKEQNTQEVELAMQDGIVFTYFLYNENKHTGTKLEEFNQMLAQILRIITTFKIIKL
jgi:hypothetical protein